jgi:hypothetical protein
MKEFAEYYCDRCMCREWQSCRLIANARTWIKTHADQIGPRFFEDVVEEYPGAFRPFMVAWCDEFGGI